MARLLIFVLSRISFWQHLYSLSLSSLVTLICKLDVEKGVIVELELEISFLSSPLNQESRGCGEPSIDEQIWTNSMDISTHL